MKFTMLSIFVLISATAFAKVDGLVCKMQYQTSSVLETSRVLSESAWLVAGQELEGPAFRSDGKGGWGTAPANFIQVSSIQIAGKPFWKVTVLDADKIAVGEYSFKEDANNAESSSSGAKLVIPADAYDEGDEDPTHFDVLEVTCRNTVFAG